MTRKEWGWLGAAVVVAVMAVLSLVAFGGYESGYGAAADDAAGAELAASRINTRHRDLPAGAGARVRGSLPRPGGDRDARVGLGLSIVKAIADAHHAPVSIRSAPGEGTTFGLDFPAGRPVTAQPAGDVP